MTVAVLALTTAAITRAVVARPVIATDDDSLAADDALRADEAHKLLLPLPIAPAMIFMVGSTASPALTWVFLGYSVAFAIAYGVVGSARTQTRTGSEEPAG
ncbi:hypothetical protein [Actinomadura alba]|uniref:Uncharacterized protein n=1 Tax=Actinomadura alba TaxID=406431 RepID=A0ABR7LI15_9ACTN|nr:hypothetical protein [Actinomadura alba]MBC6464497.1 hypothetical protein [Actinomadura alba]